MEFRKMVKVVLALASVVGLPAALQAGPYSKWIGTAPACGASAKDCEDLSLHHWMDNSYGDGHKCTSGTKVLCVQAQPSLYEKPFWLGTAPACGAKPEHCVAENAEFIAWGSAGDGNPCSTGWKVLCARKKSN